MSLLELKNKIHNIVRSFERRYESHVFFFPEDEIETSVIHVTLIDAYHDMNLYLQVNLKSLLVSDLGIEENRVPYMSCPMAAKNYDYLIGKNILKLIKEKPEKKIDSCLHINELIDEAVRAFNAAYGFFMKEKNYPKEFNEEKMFEGNLNRESRREIARHWWMKDPRIKNSCYSFNTETKEDNFEKLAKEIPSFTEMILKSKKS